MAGGRPTTIPPWPHRPGGPHVDGLTPMPADGRPGTFSLLAGVWLSDQRELHRGNLWLWPGTCGSAPIWPNVAPESSAGSGGRPSGRTPEIELGEPAQAVGPVGSVLFAHYLLAHNIGGHDGPAGAELRQTVYYRLHADGHRDRWREVVTNPLSEFR
jgi:hypothetical protein